MKTLTIISPCFYEDTSSCSLFIQSCERFHLNYYLYGLGESWPWLYEAKVVRLMQEIEHINSEFILVNDADDAFFVADENEIMSKYEKSQAKIFVSADRQQEEGDSKWPQSYFRDNYPSSSTPWRYCNSGGYLGKKDNILDLLYMMDNVKNPFTIYRSKDWNNDQFRMSLVFLQGYEGLVVDTQCNLFQTMGCIDKDEISIIDDRIYNKVTNTKPSVIHFNGNAPGIEEAYRQCFVPTIIQ